MSVMRKDRIFEFVAKSRSAQGTAEGVTAQEVADALGIWRNDAAVELNKLVSEGRLRREGKKNVRFFLPNAGEGAEEGVAPERDSTAFSKLVGTNGSLKHQISVAKAAAAYPAQGLNMLILGPTGSGKSEFARAVWEYAKELNVPRAPGGEIPFVVFNCAEYADNPQLLLSQLFGYKKGAFTGALEDKVGLVEEANGGILLLDEIHHLSAAGQELFFTLLDTGYYHRLGDNTTRESHFMLIGATTKPVTDLLETFLRRMPVVIQMPALFERPVRERLEFIEHFYAEEAVRIGRPLRIKREVLNALLSYTAHVNLGTLKNTVQISCAKGYLRQTSSEAVSEEVTITFSDLSLQRYVDEERQGERPEEAVVFPRDLLISDTKPKTAGADVPEFVDIYDFVDKSLEREAQRSLSAEEFQQLVMSEVDHYYVDMDRALRESGTDLNLLNSILLPGCVGISAEFLDMASRELNRSYSSTAPVLLAMHISQYVDRMRSEQPSFPLDFRDVMKGYVRETSFLQRNREWLSSWLNVRITDDEMNFLAIFLSQMADRNEPPEVWITVVSENEGTASSMTKFVSSVCHASHLHWVDNRSADEMDSMFKRICDNIRTFHGRSGNLIFTDMKVLVSLEYELRRATGVPCAVIPILEQHILMDACRVTMAVREELKRTYRHVLQRYVTFMHNFFRYTADGSPFEYQERPEEERTKIVLSVCVTGIGSAQSVKEILEKKLCYIPHLRIVALSTLEDFDAIYQTYGSALKLVVGTADPGLRGVPFLSADRVFTANGMQYLSAVLDDWSSESAVAELGRDEEPGGEAIRLLIENFSFIAPHVDRERAVPCIERMITMLEARYYHKMLPQDVRVRLFMHAASMLERIVSGEGLEELSLEHEQMVQEKAPWFQFVDAVVKEAFLPFGYDIPQVESFYFMLSLPEAL